MESKEYIAGLIEKARAAQREYENFTQAQADAIVRACAKAVYDNAEYLARAAVEETRMGVYEHKVTKNRGKAKVIYNSLRGVKTKGVLKDDPESGITEIARPVGVVAAVTPCTNPIVTPMCNAMFALIGFNSIIIGPHPRAKKCSAETVRLMNEAIRPLGAPENLIQIIEEPTLELSGELMREADVVVATGGAGVVRAAYSSGKPAYGVGAGNVQCIIDRGVDVDEAVKKIIIGREFDNGIICSGEQTVIAPSDEYSEVIKAFENNGCMYISDDESREKLVNAIFPLGVTNKNLVGKSARQVAEAAGLSCPDGLRAIIVKADGWGRGYPLSREKMCPVISAYEYGDFAEGVRIAQANLDTEGRGHSVSLHSNDEAHILYAGEKLTVFRVLVNQICATMNGGSFYNSLAPTTTLGCASWGGNGISENFTYKFLLNVIRIARRIEPEQIPTDEQIFG